MEVFKNPLNLEEAISESKKLPVLPYNSSPVISKLAESGSINPFEPVKVFDNVYWVGSQAVGAVVIDTGDGYVMIDDGSNDAEAQYMAESLEKLGIEEIVVLCPNCYHFLKPRLEIPVVSIYEKLHELGLGNIIQEETVNLFVPCPDKATLEMERSLLSFIPGEWENIKGIQCCGLGGCASGKEPEISASFAANLKEKNCPNVYTYCASCAGKLRRSGVKNVHHVLVDILGTGEQSELSLKSIWNRARHKFF